MAEVKWILCSERLPEKDGRYLAMVSYGPRTISGFLDELSYVIGEDGGWNCIRFYNGTVYCDSRIEDVVAWAETKELYEEAERMVKG